MKKKVVTLGEMIIRLSPNGCERFISTEKFHAYYGGAEVNVALSLSQFGHDTYFITKLPNNDIGQAGINSLRRFGVNTEYIVRGGERIGIYFAEKGASMRPSKIIYDRKHSSFSTSKFEEYDFENIFKDCYIFHISGISPALSNEAKELILKACEFAKKKNILVSYDFNYRTNLWTKKECMEFSDKIFRYVDILIGYIPKGVDWITQKLDHAEIKKGFEEYFTKYNLKLIASTIRNSISASDNQLYALMYDGKNYMISSTYDIRIVNRIGGGDAFTAGLLSEYLYGSESEKILEFAVAASSWKHTIDDDSNLATREEILQILDGNVSGKVQR